MNNNKENTQFEWAKELDAWWAEHSHNATGDALDLFNKMQTQGRSLLDLNELFTQKTNEPTDWFEAINAIFGENKKDLDKQAEAAQASAFSDSSFEALNAFWQTSIETMSKMQATAANNDAMDHWSSLNNEFDFNAFKPSAELWQKLAKAQSEYRQALHLYQQYFKDFIALAMAQLKGKVEAIVERDKTIDSARELHGLWLISCEEVYEPLVNTDEYYVLNANLINAQIELKKQIDLAQNYAMEQFNQPNKEVIKKLSLRVQTCHRETRQLRAEMSELRGIIDTLKQDATLRSKVKVQAKKNNKKSIKTSTKRIKNER